MKLQSTKNSNKSNSTSHTYPGPVIDDKLICRAWGIVNTYEQAVLNEPFLMNKEFLSIQDASEDSLNIDPVRRNTCCGLCPFLLLALLQLNHRSIKIYKLIKDHFFNYDAKAELKFSLFDESFLDKQVTRPTKIQIPVIGRHAFLFSLAAKTTVYDESKESPIWEIFTSTAIVPDHF